MNRIQPTAAVDLLAVAEAQANGANAAASHAEVAQVHQETQENTAQRTLVNAQATRDAAARSLSSAKIKKDRVITVDVILTTAAAAACMGGAVHTMNNPSKFTNWSRTFDRLWIGSASTPALGALGYLGARPCLNGGIANAEAVYQKASDELREKEIELQVAISKAGEADEATAAAGSPDPTTAGWNGGNDFSYFEEQNFNDSTHTS